MRERRRLWLLGLLAPIALAVLVSACGSSGPAATNSGSTGGTNTSANLAKAEKFSECMRSHGVSAFPDPNSSGEFTIDGIANGSSINPNAPVFQHALSACKSLEPAGFTGSPRSAAQQESALKFAQCVRESGVTDFPDPIQGQPLVDTNRIPSAATAGGKSALRAAMQKCNGLAAAAGVGAGK